MHPSLSVTFSWGLVREACKRLLWQKQLSSWERPNSVSIDGVRVRKKKKASLRNEKKTHPQPLFDYNQHHSSDFL